MPDWLNFSGSLTKLSFGWFDLLIVSLILIGLHLGNKTGASRQVLSFGQWFFTLLVAAFIHESIGEMLAPALGVRLWAGRLLAYCATAFVLLIIFFIINRKIGDKVEASTIFGKLEYVIGPFACAGRNISIALLVLAVIHGLEVNPVADKKLVKYQMDSYGMMLYPTAGSLHEAFFKKSSTGAWIGQNLTFLLVTAPTSPQDYTQTAGVK